MDSDFTKQLLLYVKERFQQDHSGHDYYHSIRVCRLATMICEKEFADLEIVQLAALLHDVDDYKLFGGTVGGFTNASEFLKKKRVPNDTIQRVCEVIAEVSFKGIHTKVPESIEGKIVQDADRLDAIGAIGIARAFAYGGSRNRDIYIPNERPRENMDFKEYSESKGTTINHFYEKLLKLKDMMNTETAKSIAEHRHIYMECFLAEFFDEWRGSR